MKEELYLLEWQLFRVDRGTRFNKQHGIPFAEEATTFLSNYEKEHADTNEKLETINEAILSLKGDCIEKGSLETGTMFMWNMLNFLESCGN